MKINLKMELKNLAGESFKKDDKAIEFKECVINAALAEFPSEKIDGTQKFKRYELAKKIKKSDHEVELTSEDVAMIKKNASQMMNTEAYGSFCEAIESSSDLKN